jgi:hypothetical protein
VPGSERTGFRVEIKEREMISSLASRNRHSECDVQQIRDKKCVVYSPLDARTIDVDR